MAVRFLIVVLAVVLLGMTGGVPVQADDLYTPAPTPTVSPPSQQQIDDARNALDRLRHPTTGPTATVADVAAPKRTRSFSPRISNDALWTVAAGLLVLLVASETTRIGFRRAKHRRHA